jgi:lipopolysaccharide transport system ATP-binding protein
MVSTSSESTSSLTATSETPSYLNAEQAHPITNPADAAAVAIRVRNLSKMYRIYDRPQDRLKQMFWRGRRQYGREFWALRDISFDVKKGETLGIIGRNGGGKSTLLQIIAGTLAPTEGDVQVNGRVAALLELGSGFNPEFTGRENVFMNGSILGFSREEMERRFDDIAAFADIGSFLDQPVKLYSSGMFVRLAFAVTTYLDPDILLIDEALAVGDIFFSQKCYRRLESMLDSGVAVALVSHNLVDIQQFCQRGIVLRRGQMKFHGPSSEAVRQYLLTEQRDTAVGQASPPAESPPGEASTNGRPLNVDDPSWAPPDAMLDISGVPQVSNNWARCTGVAICDSAGRSCHVFEQGQQATFFYEFEVLQNLEVPISGLVIQNEKGIVVHGKNTLQADTTVPTFVKQGSWLRFRQDVTLDIAVGEYTFEVGLATIGQFDYGQRDVYAHHDLYAKIIYVCHVPAVGQFTVTYRSHHQPVQLLHHGLVDLPGAIEAKLYTIDKQ